MNQVMRPGLPHRKKNYETQLSINLMMRNEIEKKNKLTKKDLKKQIIIKKISIKFDIKIKY